MLDFSDAPYQFFPATPDPFVMWLCRQANRFRILPGRKHRVREIILDGALPRVRELADSGERILFVPNHSTHSDPQVITEVQRRLGRPSCFMAAYDIFLRSRFQAWVMRHNGAFSVDREGSDRKSMTAAIDILAAGRHALTIFPEGNVYMMNDRVTPFLEGAAFLALKAQKGLGPGQHIHAVPVSMKFSHLHDVRGPIREQLAGIAHAAGTDFDPDTDPVAELVRIGRFLLARNLRQRGYLSRGEDIGGGDLEEDLRNAVERIIAGLEEKVDLHPKPADEPVARVRRIRATIHQTRTDPGREMEHRVASSWADEAILALRILSYAQPYVREKPTLDRYAETVEKLGEDLFSRWQQPLGERRAVAWLGEPVDLGAFLENFSGKPRESVSELTALCENRVQTGLDRVNQALDTEGAKPF